MTSALSKRQQARNEKILQDILHSVPGNNFCADCQARNPTWASWSLGIFLCMRCAAIHRKLGTHISKVKSLSMDSWSNEQVENMRKVGNTVSNKNYNPQNKKPPVPVDADEADSAMERFIRSKYVNHGLGSTKKHNTGSTASDETPPPLPPKTPSRFGFRSASSIFPLGHKSKKAAGVSRDPSTSPRDAPTSPRRGKSSSESDSFEETERKLARLRDMGFNDHQRNAIVLKGVNGNLERAIEALVRLGEGDKINGLTTRATQENGLSFNRSSSIASGSGHEVTQPRPLSPRNPFDMLDMPPAPQPLSSQSTGTLSSRNPFGPVNTNPFGVPAQPSTVSLNEAFQGLSLVPNTQTLFPHHTGVPQQNSQVTYQQPMTPPIPQTNQFTNIDFNSTQTYSQPQRMQPSATGSYNPFFTNQQQAQEQQLQQQQQQQLQLNTGLYGANYANNPFARSPTRIASPTSLTQIPEQSQPMFYTQTPPAQPQVNNPFFAQAAPQTQFPAQQLPQQQTGQLPQQQGQYGQWQMAPSATWSQPQRPDKASIMALYNYPQLAPNPFQPAQDQAQPQPQAQTQAAPAPQGTPNPLFHAQTFPLQQQSQAAQQPAQPSGPAPGNKNPFLSNSAIQVETGTSPSGQPPLLTDFAPQSKASGRSRDSIMATGPEWMNGRHSPDAFASLSAREVR